MSEIDDATTEDLEQALLNDATEGIKSVSVDGLTVTSDSLRERQEVLDRNRNANAASTDWFGMRHRQLRSGAGGFP
jgi:hypothetical protein